MLPAGALRYSTGTMMVHLAVKPDGCGWTAKCGAYCTSYSGGMPRKICKRCIPADHVAIARGVVAFIRWARDIAVPAPCFLSEYSVTVTLDVSACSKEKAMAGVISCLGPSGARVTRSAVKER